MNAVNNNSSKGGYELTAEDEEVIEVLDSRVYNPIGRFQVFYYLAQGLVHCLLIGVLFNIWTGTITFFVWHPTFAIIGIYLYAQGKFLQFM
jgi:hypothetical protein